MVLKSRVSRDRGLRNHYGSGNEWLHLGTHWLDFIFSVNQPFRRLLVAQWLNWRRSLTSFLSLCAYDYRRARAAIPLGHLVLATLMVEEFCPGGLPSGVWAAYCTDYKVAQFNLVIAFLIV